MFCKKIEIDQTRINFSSDLENIDISSFIINERLKLISYIKRNPDFKNSLEPVPRDDSLKKAPLIVKMMDRASRKGEVGPMAAVAGTIAELSLSLLLKKGSKYSIIDNGGDIALKTNKKIVSGLYAGNSSLSGKIGFEIKAGRAQGICTSSGTIGHSISFGRSDSVTVFARQASVADALASSIANEANGELDHDAVQNSLERADDFKEYLQGVLVIVGESAGTLGKIPTLVKTDKKRVLGDLFEV
ncbi:MAG: UPF0280 family protein [Euryarchaeota archaeon]|nr:UPF0280 family protein [Euryarchaeota archaeon]MBV1729666.1 UPF0280 family protein [Methanobacterium sp.]MBU4547303.1 UPF0280 family protein [Euryarchaeota archaeon]MBU4607822.1 UPF0280 family protein [Euryarchaeota archaeon]MBV1755800.1 UPF0280 family protein [Methanobacterium sp.]